MYLFDSYPIDWWHISDWLPILNSQGEIYGTRSYLIFSIVFPPQSKTIASEVIIYITGNGFSMQILNR